MSVSMSGMYALSVGPV